MKKNIRCFEIGFIYTPFHTTNLSMFVFDELLRLLCYVGSFGAVHFCFSRRCSFFVNFFLCFPMQCRVLGDVVEHSLGTQLFYSALSVYPAVQHTHHVVSTGQHKLDVVSDENLQWPDDEDILPQQWECCIPQYGSPTTVH
jgi:hypothetical protein